ncbi:MAG: hypothetical protein R3304_12715, partial [Longimicrobiales bacterium]|nr:hypothetical protein [Longimicrobiales bacterium]
LLYAGTETGIYVSFDGGAAWRSLQLDLPVTPVNDLMVHERENDLVVATSGRSFWILDELQPLRQATEVGQEANHLFAPGHAYRWADGGGFGGGGEGQNPPGGAVLDFVLAQAPDSGDVVELEIRTAAGDRVRTLSTDPDEELSPGASALRLSEGANRVVWDLRHEAIPNIPGAYVFGSLRGRRVVPGEYEVTLRVDDWSMSQPLEVRMDPRLDATIQDYVDQDLFVAEVAAELAQIHRAAERTDDVRGQIEAILERIEGMDVPEAVTQEGQALASELETVADSLYQRRTVDGQTVINFPTRLKFQYVFLHGNADADAPGVSRGSRDVLRDLRTRWNVHRETAEDLLGPRLDAFNRALQEAGVSVIVVPETARRPVS